MKRIGVIGVAGGWSSEKMADAVGERTGFRLLIDMGRVRLDLASGRAEVEGTVLNDLDGLIIKKIGAVYSPDLIDRLELLRFLNERGLPMFSRPGRILRLLDRLSCTVSLRLAGVPLPPTVVTEDAEGALAAVEEYGEAVLKPLFTSKARGMRLVRAGEGAREAIEAHRRENPILYVQKRIELNGRDLGVVFLGGEYLTTYARRNRNGAWNTTTASGGEYEACEPRPETLEAARRAQEPFGLDFTCVDVAETAEGPMVFEVSAFGGFRGIEEARGMDAAGLFADYAVSKIGGGA